MLTTTEVKEKHQREYTIKSHHGQIPVHLRVSCTYHETQCEWIADLIEGSCMSFSEALEISKILDRLNKEEKVNN